MKGILFKADLVQRTLAGAKTQTRRDDLAWAKVKKGERIYIKERLNRTVTWQPDGSPIRVAMFEDGEQAHERGNLALWRWARDWLSPLHMPASCARYVLEATEDGRVERLLDISEADAVAEGFESDMAALARLSHLRGSDACAAVPSKMHSARDAFLSRWRAMSPCPTLPNGAHPGRGCDTCNPLVAILSFRLVTP